MVDLKKLKKIIFHSIIFSFVIISIKPSYAIWYEEPIVMEKQDNIDSMWWLSKKKKEKLKKEQAEELIRWKEENKKSNHIKWLYDENNITKYPSNKWEIIDENKTGVGYNYYFDENGYLLKDTITPDFKIVDKKGREVDNDLRPIVYYMTSHISQDEVINRKILDEAEEYKPIEKEPAKVIIGKGVVLRDKKKIYDNTKSKDMLLYVDASNRFIKETKGIIANEVRWKKCSSFKGNDGFLIFNNPDNNFNKVIGKIAMEYHTDEDDTEYVLKVYDADLYDRHNDTNTLYDLEEIYSNNMINKVSPYKFEFTFERSIKRIRFEIEVNGEHKNRTFFFKDMKYGFSKTAFYDEIIRKKEENEEIEELKRLGIWVNEDEYVSFEALDEDGNIIEEYDEDVDEEYNYSYYDDEGDYHQISEIDEYTYEDKVRDKNTGPAFDKSIQNEHTWRDSGPAFIKEYSQSTKSSLP